MKGSKVIVDLANKRVETAFVRPFLLPKMDEFYHLEENAINGKS